MKTAIIYYSYSGNTRRIAGILNEYFKTKGAVDIVELKALDESDKFFSQAIRAFRHKRAKLEPVNFDLTSYDLICFGTPVWAFTLTPELRTYLEKCHGLVGKKAVVFTTYGSGTGNKKCIREIDNFLKEKGIKETRHFSISQFKVDNGDFVRGVIEGAFSNL